MQKKIKAFLKSRRGNKIPMLVYKLGGPTACPHIDPSKMIQGQGRGAAGLNKD